MEATEAAEVILIIAVGVVGAALVGLRLHIMVVAALAALVALGLPLQVVAVDLAALLALMGPVVVWAVPLEQRLQTRYYLHASVLEAMVTQQLRVLVVPEASVAAVEVVARLVLAELADLVVVVAVGLRKVDKVGLVVAAAVAHALMAVMVVARVGQSVHKSEPAALQSFLYTPKRNLSCTTYI